MVINKQLLQALKEAMGREDGSLLCLDFKPDKENGLGGTFVSPRPEEWTCLPNHVPFYWPTGKFRYFKHSISIGPRRHKKIIDVLITDAINNADLRQLQRTYVTLTGLSRAKV